MKRIVYLIIICLALARCGISKIAAESGPGSRNDPYTVGVAATYDGMKIRQEEKYYQAEITLKDVCRGEQAKEIFRYGEFSYSRSYETLVGEDMEMLVARFDVHILKTEKDQPVSLEGDAITRFKLVSEAGQEYKYFPLSAYIDAGNMMFGDLYEGGKQTGHLFYLVKKDDQNPLIVFENKVNGGLWFKTTIPEEELGDDRMIVEDWIAPKKEAERAEWQKWNKEENLSNQRKNEIKELQEKYGGTQDYPLQPGEWGLLINKYDDYSLELCVLDFMRGEEAKNFIATQNIESFKNGEGLESGKEFLVVHIQANLQEISEAKYKNEAFELNYHDFELSHGQKGKKYSIQDKIGLNHGRPGVMIYQGTQDFYQAFIVDTSDTSPKMYYRSGSDELFFVISSEQESDHQKELYQPVNPTDAFKKDASKRKGSINNPYLVGESYTVNYQPADEKTSDVPFKADIKLLESYRGEEARQFVKYYGEEAEQSASNSVEAPSVADSELLVLKLEINLIELKGNDAAFFRASRFMLFNENGSEIDAKYLYSFSLQDELDEIYHTGTTDGYIGYLIPKGETAVYLTSNRTSENEKKQFIEVINGD